MKEKIKELPKTNIGKIARKNLKAEMLKTGLP